MLEKVQTAPGAVRFQQVTVRKSVTNEYMCIQFVHVSNICMTSYDLPTKPVGKYIYLSTAVNVVPLLCYLIVWIKNNIFNTKTVPWLYNMPFDSACYWINHLSWQNARHTSYYKCINHYITMRDFSFCSLPKSNWLKGVLSSIDKQ